MSMRSIDLEILWRTEALGQGDGRLGKGLDAKSDSAQHQTPPRLGREFLGGGAYDFFLFFSSKRRKYASSSFSVAQPAKYRHNISNVRLVGLCPVHRAISK